MQISIAQYTIEVQYPLMRKNFSAIHPLIGQKSPFLY